MDSIMLRTTSQISVYRRYTSLTLIIRMLMTISVTMDDVMSSQEASDIALDQNEFCQWETFNATCERGEVVVMTSARYGRMRFGRCVREDHGNHGCYADVLHHLDKRCSGRQSCQLVIPDATLHATHPCPKELMPYLDANYICVKVYTGNRHFCEIFGERRITSDDGYLGLMDAHDDALVGTETCPWVLHVDEGRKITVTLLNFDLQTHLNAPQVEATEACSYHVIIEDGENRVMTSSCENHMRESIIHVSQSNSLKIYTRKIIDRKPHFLLRFQVSGCATLHSINNGWTRRQGDTTLVTCNSTGSTYFLSCLNNRWVGNVDNCTAVSNRETADRQEADWRFPTAGILLMIGVGVSLGVALGIFMLFGILFCLKKDGDRRQRSTTTDPLLGGSKMEIDSAAVYDVRHHVLPANNLGGGQYFNGRGQKPDLYADAPSCTLCHGNSSPLMAAPSSLLPDSGGGGNSSNGDGGGDQMRSPDEACLYVTGSPYAPQSDDQKLYQSTKTVNSHVIPVTNRDSDITPLSASTVKAFATFRPKAAACTSVSSSSISPFESLKRTLPKTHLSIGRNVQHSHETLMLECKCSLRQPNQSPKTLRLPNQSPITARRTSLDEPVGPLHNCNTAMSVV